VHDWPVDQRDTHYVFEPDESPVEHVALTDVACRDP
jgi:hypothetical protein